MVSMRHIHNCMLCLVDLDPQFFLIVEYNTPYSKMTENTLLFCLIVNWPLLPQSHLQNSKEYLA